MLKEQLKHFVTLLLKRALVSLLLPQVVGFVPPSLGQSGDVLKLILSLGRKVESRVFSEADELKGLSDQSLCVKS